MREIMEVARYIRKELKMADEYAYEAVKHREQFPDMAQHYYKVSMDHLTAADDLHVGAVRMIDMAKRGGAEPSDVMKRVWEHEHEMMIDEKDCVMRKLNMFKA